MFSLLDQELQKELISFCEKEGRDKNPKPLKISLVAELLRQITAGQREITGLMTNNKTGDVFVRLSFTKEQEK